MVHSENSGLKKLHPFLSHYILGRGVTQQVITDPRSNLLKLFCAKHDQKATYWLLYQLAWFHSFCFVYAKEGHIIHLPNQHALGLNWDYPWKTGTYGPLDLQCCSNGHLFMLSLITGCHRWQGVERSTLYFVEEEKWGPALSSDFLKAEQLMSYVGLCGGMNHCGHGGRMRMLVESGDFCLDRAPVGVMAARSCSIVYALFLLLILDLLRDRNLEFWAFTCRTQAWCLARNRYTVNIWLRTF